LPWHITVTIISAAIALPGRPGAAISYHWASGPIRCSRSLSSWAGSAAIARRHSRRV